MNLAEYSPFLETAVGGSVESEKKRLAKFIFCVSFFHFLLFCAKLFKFLFSFFSEITLLKLKKKKIEQSSKVTISRLKFLQFISRQTLSSFCFLSLYIRQHFSIQIFFYFLFSTNNFPRFVFQPKVYKYKNEHFRET